MGNVADGEWFFFWEGKQEGPVSAQEIVALIRRDRSAKLPLWTEGMAEWADAREVDQFKLFYPPGLAATSATSRALDQSPKAAPALTSTGNGRGVAGAQLGVSASPEAIPEYERVGGLSGKLTDGIGLKRLLFSAQGRIGRKLYWLSLLYSLALAIGIFVVLGFLLVAIAIGTGHNEGSLSIWHWVIILTLVIYAPTRICAAAKRLHDFGFVGWWQLLPVPLMFLLQYWGAGAQVDVIVPVTFVAFLPVCVYGLMPGNKGANRFGHPLS